MNIDHQLRQKLATNPSSHHDQFGLCRPVIHFPAHEEAGHARDIWVVQMFQFDNVEVVEECEVQVSKTEMGGSFVCAPLRWRNILGQALAVFLARLLRQVFLHSFQASYCGLLLYFTRAIASTAPPQTDESSSWSAQTIKMKRDFLTRGPTSSQHRKTQWPFSLNSQQRLLILVIFES